jgi:hypothetical protein
VTERMQPPGITVGAGLLKMVVGMVFVRRGNDQ